MELSDIETILETIKDKVERIENYMAKKEYFEDYMVKKDHFDSVISEIKNELYEIKNACAK